MKDLKLCYVDNDYVYFTTNSLKMQWGDDWDNAPYEDNAGIPYRRNYANEKENKPFEIVRIPFWKGQFQTPNEFACGKSCYSVKDINNGACSWLYDPYSKTAISAGSTISEFKEKIAIGEGTLYIDKQEVLND